MKVSLAYEVLSLVDDDPNMKIIEDKYRSGLKELHQNILNVMKTQEGSI